MMVWKQYIQWNPYFEFWSFPSLETSSTLFCDSKQWQVQVPVSHMVMGVKISTLWPPHGKSWLIAKDSDAGRDWVQEKKGTTEDEMAGWHHWLDGCESEWTPGVGDTLQAWRAAIHGVAKSQTRLSDWTDLTLSHCGVFISLWMHRLLYRNLVSFLWMFPLFIYHRDM